MTDIVERARFLASGQYDPHSITIAELCAEIERLRRRLRWQDDRDGVQSTHNAECYSFGHRHYECALQEVERLRDERDALKTVMIAAAEEIAAHWDAHCGAEGYGPQNLLRRLEEGIPSEYGYTAGAFAELKAERDALRADALRYRWLRSRARIEDRDGGWVGLWRLPMLDAWNDSPNPAYQIERRTFDAAIDAAMAQKD